MDKAPQKPKARVFLLDAHEAARRSLARLIEDERDMVVCGEAPDLTEAMKRLSAARADALVINIDPLNGGGLTLINRLRWHYPALPLVVVTLRETAVYGRRLMQAGAAGIVLQGEASCDIIPALRQVLGGGIYAGRPAKRDGRRRKG